MQQHGIKNNIQIRPHCKTHKCSKLAALQLEYGAIGICAAKISEAEALINAGIHEVLITSPIVTDSKILRLAECIKRAPNLMTVVDNEENIVDLNQAGKSIQQKINVLVDLDSGIGRTGVNFDNALSFALKTHNMEWLNLVGIQCYAGNLQHIHNFNQRKAASLAIMQHASDMFDIFIRHGLPCSILTGTGTGTYDIDIDASNVTEIQPGSYTVMDVEYAAIEAQNNPYSFTTFRPAMTLLTSVISSNRNEHVTVDAGTKSIYVDPNYKPKIISHLGLTYDWGGFGDEHGKIVAIDQKVKLPKNKDILELIVPHCDPTINLYDQFFIIENNIVVDVWPIDLRGKAQ